MKFGKRTLLLGLAALSIAANPHDCNCPGTLEKGDSYGEEMTEVCRVSRNGMINIVYAQQPMPELCESLQSSQ